MKNSPGGVQTRRAHSIYQGIQAATSCNVSAGPGAFAAGIGAVAAGIGALTAGIGAFAAGIGAYTAGIGAFAAASADDASGACCSGAARGNDVAVLRLSTTVGGKLPAPPRRPIRPGCIVAAASYGSSAVSRNCAAVPGTFPRIASPLERVRAGAPSESGALPDEVAARFAGPRMAVRETDRGVREPARLIREPARFTAEITSSRFLSPLTLPIAICAMGSRKFVQKCRITHLWHESCLPEQTHEMA